jgi:hypothetical protein
MKSDLRIPHFLRVTQALAFVSGFGLPVTAGCGGAFTPEVGPESDGASSYDGSGQPSPGGGGVQPAPPYEGGVTGTMLPYDGAVTGVLVRPDASLAHDGGPTGVLPYDGAVTGIVVHPDASLAYDGGPTGVTIYDGGPTGISIYDGGPLGVIVQLDGGHLVVGGPLLPPELPA